MRSAEQPIIKASGLNRLGALSFLLCVCLVFSSCEKEEPCIPPDEIPLRTVLCYMGGDNNLSYEVAEKVGQLQAASIGRHCRLLIYQDTRDANPSLSEVVTEKNGVNTVRVINEYEPSNSADADVFGSVLREVADRYPSQSYGLVLFSHASGWLPEHTYHTPALRSGTPALRSIVIDNRAEMELPAFAAVIPDGMFDFIIFEACFMAGIEVAWELKDKADYIVASSAEIASPGFTNSYSTALPLLFEPVADLTGFVRAIEADYRTRSGDYASLTLSVIQTKGLDALAAALRAHLLKGENEFAEHGEGRSHACIQSFDRGNNSLFFDFGDYFERLVLDAHSLQTALSQCVVYKVATPDFMPSYGGFEVKSHSGLTTYIPQEKYPNLNEAYKELKWYKQLH
ncbi:clostripain-related cysteine peptidase [Arcticibacter sp.]|uniref:clostripain-related cysteine peptidase n=1 Tax=Arcticibacter sp. TaxID=1872630 RepID=UPI00388E1F37